MFQKCIGVEKKGRAGLQNKDIKWNKSNETVELYFLCEFRSSLRRRDHAEHLREVQEKGSLDLLL